jgi:hypothetical protein
MKQPLEIIKKIDAYMHLQDRMIYESDGFIEQITQEDKVHAVKLIQQSVKHRGLTPYLSQYELNIIETPKDSTKNDNFYNLVPYINIATNILLWAVGLTNKVETGLYSLNKWKKRFKFGDSNFDHEAFTKRNNLSVREYDVIYHKYLYYKIILEVQKKLKGKKYSDKLRIKTYQKAVKQYGYELFDQAGIKYNEKGFLYYAPAMFFNGHYNRKLYAEATICLEVLDFVLSN